jgi:hypothetical protein
LTFSCHVSTISLIFGIGFGVFAFPCTTPSGVIGVASGAGNHSGLFASVCLVFSACIFVFISDKRTFSSLARF